MHLLPVTPGHNNSRIHILEIIGNASVGGMENYIKSFLAHLPADQFEISCICPYESAFTNSLRELGVKNVFITPIEDDPQWHSIQLVMEVARLYEIDLLHAHMPKAHVLAGLVGCLINKPVVATLHGMHVTAHELGITRAVNSHLITNCQEAYTQALAMGVPPSRVNMIRNGVDTKVFAPSEKDNDFRSSLNIPLNVPLIGFVGRLDHEKGPDLFLRVAEFIHQQKPAVHFVVAGDGSMRKELIKLSRRLGLQNHVHFVQWCKDTSVIYPELDVLAHTSRSDGTSLVLLEAMACECPTVALTVGGVRDVVEHGSTGLLAGAGDWEGVGIRIIELLEQPELMKALGKAGRLRVKKLFDVEVNTMRTAEIMESIACAGIVEKQFAPNSSLISKKNSAVVKASSKTEAG